MWLFFIQTAGSGQIQAQFDSVVTLRFAQNTRKYTVHPNAYAFCVRARLARVWGLQTPVGRLCVGFTGQKCDTLDSVKMMPELCVILQNAIKVTDAAVQNEKEQMKKNK